MIEREPIRRTGTRFIAECSPHAVLALHPRGIIVAAPDAPPYLLRHDGEREEFTVKVEPDA